MRVSYRGISRESDDNLGFMLFDRYTLFVNFNLLRSRYEGLYSLEDNDPVKSLVRIRLDKKILSIERGPNFIKRRYKDNSDSITLCGGIEYETEREDEIAITFDFKRIFDNSEDNRKYGISLKGDTMSVLFEKDGVQRSIKVRGVKSIIKEGWIKEEYPLDRERKSPPFERWAYNIIIRGKRVVIGKIEGNNKKERYNSDDEKKIAFDCAVSSLRGMISEKGISAGFPWFFQVWSRDELVSSGSLLSLGETNLFKKIIFKNIRLIDEEGLLRSNPDSDLKSIDGIFWLFKRIDQGIKREIFSKGEIGEIKEVIVSVINSLEDSRMKYPFICSKPLESWIDTSYGEDNREGRLIELQSGLALLYCLAYDLTKDKIYSRLLDELKSSFRREFFIDGTLRDNLDDDHIRPNLFLAYYIFPYLLKKEEWRSAFDHALDKLWLDWGGVSSIGKDDSLFTPRYTGEDNKSYHRGDSWFWINDIAAIVMHQTGGFDEYVKKIYLASKEELLWKGCIGSCGELSSAEELKSEGCFVQAWSNAIFIELCEMLKAV